VLLLVLVAVMPRASIPPEPGRASLNGGAASLCRRPRAWVRRSEGMIRGAVPDRVVEARHPAR